MAERPTRLLLTTGIALAGALITGFVLLKTLSVNLDTLEWSEEYDEF
jgi:hypothetical protein